MFLRVSLTRRRVSRFCLLTHGEHVITATDVATADVHEVSLDSCAEDFNRIQKRSRSSSHVKISWSSDVTASVAPSIDSI